MERAHVFVRLQDEALSSSTVGISRTSATTVRLEHSEMSPGVANLTFEQVFDVDDSNLHVFQTSLTGPVDSVIDGKAVTLIATGTTSSDTSFACHGDKEKSINKKAEPGLITLAIRRIFSNLKMNLKNKEWYNVLLSCWGIRRSETSKNDTLTNLLGSETCVMINIEKNIEEVLVERGVMVSTSTEAEHLYSRAFDRMKDAENQGFLFVLHVETVLPSGEARRGRLLVVKTNEGFINERRGEELTYQKEDGQQNILNTPLSKNEVLSAGFGSFIGQPSLTYLLVTIPTPAQFQQQAIQSLLYACKAQEIKSLSSRNSSSTFGERSDPNQFLETQTRSLQKTGNQTAGFCRKNSVAPGAPSYQTFRADGSTAPPLPPTSSSLSTTSSDSTHELSFFTHSTQQEESQTVSTRCSPSTSCGSEDFEKESIVSMRLRRAYELAEAATSSPRKSSTSDSISSDEVVSDVAGDELLKHIPRDARHPLTLQANFSRIRAAQVDPGRALVHEISTKDKCADRISRLSRNMTCRVAEHEQQLHEALTAQHAAETQLRNSHIKFDDVGREVARLQEEVKALKARQQVLTDDGDAQLSEIDRAMLRTLSVRLDEAMIQAKDVITLKDGVIHSLEERLQLASKRGADAVTMLKEERGQFEREKAHLVRQSNEKSKNDKGNTEEFSRLQAENVAIQQQKADLTRRVAQLTAELETARLQWTQEARDREERAEQRCAEQIFHAEQQLGQATAAMQHQMAQFRDELDARMTRQRVATQVACKAGELKKDQLERELQRMKLKLTKQKVKMEKKSRALVATAYKQYEQSVALLERKLDDQSARIDTMLEREQVTLRRARKSEKAVEEWQTETQQLQASITELERERNALKDLCKELKIDNEALKGELERQLLEMEQSVAQQIIAAETRMHEERDVQVENIVKQHNHEISRLRAATREQKSKMIQIVQQQSLATVSSQVSSAVDDLLFSDSCEQRSIDELDAKIGGSKERLYKRVGQRRIAGNSSRLSSSSSPTKNASSLKRALAHKEEEIKKLSARQKQLLTALATANEQETLAKKHIHETEAKRQRELARYEELLQQLHCVKQENWNLNLALHVTEAATCSS